MTNPSDNNHYLPIEEETIDFKKLFYQILGNWYWFAISLFLGLFIVYLINRYSEPIYSVKASILIEGADGRKFGPGVQMLMKEMNLSNPTKRLENEIGILKSYTLTYKTINELKDFHITYVSVGRRGIKESKLYNRTPFKVTFDSLKAIPYGVPFYITFLTKDKFLLENVRDTEEKNEYSFNDTVVSNNYRFVIELTINQQIEDYVGRKYYFVANHINNLTKSYVGNLNIELNNEKGSILTLSSTGYVPEQVATYLNTLMNVYIRQGLDEKNRIAENTITFIDKQLEEMSDSLKRAEKALQNFRVNNKIIDLGSEASLLFDKLKTLEDERATYNIKNRYYFYLKRYLLDKKELKDIIAPTSMEVDDPQLSSLLTQISEAYLERAEQLITSKTNNYALNQIENRLNNLKSTLEEKVNSLIDANKLALTDITNRVELVEKEMLRLPLNERQLINIEREFNIIDKLYTYLLEKRAEAAISKASNVPDSRILDYALPENTTLIKPKKRMNYSIGFVLSLSLPLAFILLYNLLNNKITDIKEIHKVTKTPVIGSIGHNKFTTEFPVFEKPKSILTESFRAVRTNLQYLLREPSQKVITITSTISGEGKTFIAANLAAIISLNHKRVLVLGLDLRKPKLQNYFGTEFQKGLSTYLIGRDSAEDVVFSTNYENLFYIPSGPIPPNPAELIGSTKMEELIIWAKANFDYIILDTPPIAIVSDALISQKFSDIILFIVRFKYSNKEVLRLVDSLKTSSDQKNIALIINDIQHTRFYGYNYGYTYGYNYGYTLTYGYGEDKSYNSYYTDDSPQDSWLDKIKRWL